MKKFIGILAAIVILLLLASPALAASLGISPSTIQLEVPENGNVTANFRVHYFSGDLKVSLVDIPLEVEPETIYIEPSSGPVAIEVTIYGDESLGHQVYDGYIRFIGMSGGTVAVAVKVKAKVTNVAEGQEPEGQPVSQEPSPTAGQTTPEETATPEQTAPEQNGPEQTAPAPPKPDQTAPEQNGPDQATEVPTEGGLPLIPIGAIAAGVVIVMAVVILMARRR